MNTGKQNLICAVWGKCYTVCVQDIKKPIVVLVNSHKILYHEISHPTYGQELIKIYGIGNVLPTVHTHTHTQRLI